LKITKKIFSLFNLILFVGSFGFSSISGLASTHYYSQEHTQKHFAAKENTENNCSQILFEKNENENESENDIQLQALLLPFFASYFQLEVQDPAYTPAQPLSLKYTNPIYISVCNFRI
jgi:hypothetical protein